MLTCSLDIMVLDLTFLLAPFFAILRSPLSTGPITSAALSSLHTFFVNELISPESVSLDAALIELSSTISHCKFEASDSSGDEVVLLKIMTVIQDTLCGSVGSRLGDVEVCEMLETVLTTCCQMRLSGECVIRYYTLSPHPLAEILRRSAEGTMHVLVRKVFSRLHALDPKEEEAKLVVPENEAESELKMSVTPIDAPESAPEPPATTQPEEVAEQPEEEHLPPPSPGIKRAECKCTMPHALPCSRLAQMVYLRLSSFSE